MWALGWMRAIDIWLNR